MNQRKLFVTLLISGILCGCSGFYFPFVSKAQKSSSANSQALGNEVAVTSVGFVDQGKILNRGRLQQPLNLAVYPFHAGVNVAANSDVDKTALMIIKGITEALATDTSGRHGHFTVLTAESPQTPDIIVKGRILHMSEPSSWKQWLPASKRRSLTVSGKLSDAKTGEVFVTFQDSQTAGRANEDFQNLGYQIGTNIARFLLSGID